MVTNFAELYFFFKLLVFFIGIVIGLYSMNSLIIYVLIYK